MTINKPSKTLVLPVISWRRVGGLESVTMDIASAFVKIGWRVKVFSVFDPEPQEEMYGVETVSLSPHVRWQRSLWRRYFWRPVLAKCVHDVLAGGGVLLFGHAHLLPLLDRLSKSAAARKWVWVYGLEVWGGEADRWLARLNQLDRVVSISRFTADQVVRAGLTAQVDMVPACVDTRQFTPTKTPERIRRSEILICGRMAAHERYKGHDLLLECLPIAERLVGQTLTLRVVGAGDDLDRLRARARQLNLEDRVIFTGRLPLPQLVEAYRHCGVFCMPSRLERRERGYWTGEGFGIVYVEAAACGRPVIASTDGGAPEAILPGETGLLADPRSPQSVAHAIADILRDPVEADAIGKRGRRMVEQRFSSDIFLRNIQELLERDIQAGQPC